MNSDGPLKSAPPSVRSFSPDEVRHLLERSPVIPVSGEIHDGLVSRNLPRERCGAMENRRKHERRINRRWRLVVVVHIYPERANEEVWRMQETKAVGTPLVTSQNSPFSTRIQRRRSRSKHQERWNRDKSKIDFPPLDDAGLVGGNSRKKWLSLHETRDT